MIGKDSKDKMQEMINKVSRIKVNNKKYRDSDLTVLSTPAHKSFPGKLVKRDVSSMSCDLDMRTDIPVLVCPFAPEHCRESSKSHQKFIGLLNSCTNIDINVLRNLAWNGIPDCIRLRTWQILSGVLPTNTSAHAQIINHKRNEYRKLITSYYENRFAQSHSKTLRQICIDIPRTFPLYPFFQNEHAQKIYERILYIWAVRHPASSYVQGINDLIGPIIFAALFPYFGPEVFSCDPSALEKDVIDGVEADCFWLLSKLLDKIIENYTPDQPGIQLKIHRLKRLIEESDKKLYNKLVSLAFHEIFFGYKWINNLFVRDLNFKCVVRLWDTLWAQTDGFDFFILFVCGALLSQFKGIIMEISEQFNLVLFFQDLPTSTWTECQMNELLAQSYLLYSLYSHRISRYK